MEQISYYSSVAGFILVMALWFGFAGVFIRRKKTEPTTDGEKVPVSFLGLGLQAVGFFSVWGFRRTPFFSPFIGRQYILNILFQVAAVLIAGSSVWLALSAVSELGKQWSLQARLVEGHQLITSGAYRIVRHPIYTSMLGMLVATGLIYSGWIATLIGIVIFIIGTRIRTNSEERLLKGAFGNEFMTWKNQVPGLIPYLPKRFLG